MKPRRKSPPEPRPFPTAPRADGPFLRYAGAIFLVALAVRLLHVYLLSRSPFFDALLGDAVGYDDWARRIAGGQWIGTDVFCDVLNQGEFVNFGNNQLLAADTQSGEIKRFLTGPVGCEITGPVFAPDGRSLFVNIQHPGENANMRSDPSNAKAFSSWPDGDKGNKPRSATIVIRKDDGGVIGS